MTSAGLSIMLGTRDQQSTLLKLDADCLEELFEWLSLKDLLALRRTCKRLKKVVDYHILTNYPASGFAYKKVYISCHSVNKFSQLDACLVQRIKEVNVMFNDMTGDQIEGIRGILCQADKIDVIEWYWDHEVNQDFYEFFLKFCKNTKYLSISNIQRGPIIGIGNEWLLRSYPQLQHLQLNDSDLFGEGHSDKIPELAEFFTCNPNVRTFSTTFHMLKLNGDFLKAANVKLDRLTVFGDWSRDDAMYELCNLLKELYRKGFYQRLHFHVYHTYSEENLQQIVSAPAIEKLHLMTISAVMPPLVHLKELCITTGDNFADLDAVAKNLLNVERIFIARCSSNFIVPFIRYAPKVRHLKVVFLSEGMYFDGKTVDLLRMNQERQLLSGASKTNIYVNEKVFLATKWTANQVSVGLIELKRDRAYGWETGI